MDVIADSGTVEAYLITKQEMQYLSDALLESIYEAIVQVKEPDRPTKGEQILERRDSMIKERKKKELMVKSIIRQGKVEKFGVMALKDNM